MSDKEYEKWASSLFREMYVLQDSLNRKISEDWIRERTMFDFFVALRQEISEYIDSFPWKWWKKMENDIENQKVEIVDMWHFIMSFLMKLYSFKEPPYLFDYLANKSARNYLASSNDLEILFLKPKTRKGSLRFIKEVQNIEVAFYFLANQDAPYVGKTTLSKEDENLVNHALYAFFFLVRFYFSGLANFAKYYFVKNILNEIRQNNGYKEGTYQKIINKREDNEIFFNLAKDIDFTTFEEFNSKLLEKVNSTLNKS